MDVIVHDGESQDIDSHVDGLKGHDVDNPVLAVRKVLSRQGILSQEKHLLGYLSGDMNDGHFVRRNTT
jgi:hypothetical protein